MHPLRSEFRRNDPILGVSREETALFGCASPRLAGVA